MDDQHNGNQFDTDVFLLEIKPHDFFQWLLHVLEPVATKLGLVSVQWAIDRSDTNAYGVIEIAKLTEGGHWRDILVTIDVLPMSGGRSIVELRGIEGRDNSELIDLITNAILADWPEANAEQQMDRRRQEKEWRSPISLSDLAGTAPSPDKLAQDKVELDKLDAVYKRNLKNEGGHPPLKCNEWAYAELCRRPHEKEQIYRNWRPMYIREVGREAASARDLREVFNAAMRYRKQREEKKDRSA